MVVPNAIKTYENADRDPYVWPGYSEDWPPPETLYVDRGQTTSSCPQGWELRLVYNDSATGMSGMVDGEDDVLGGVARGSAQYYCRWRSPTVGVVKIESLTWDKGDPSNLDLDDCPNNGGKRIFPDKLSPTDASTLRQQVKLVATITPPKQGVTVYFKVFDVDDPFDNENGSMPNVSVLDDTPATGPDNRPIGEPDPALVVLTPATTDSNGKATKTITVSMQPGNNYRAAASLLQGALMQPTILGGQTVNPQQHADALNLSGGIWSGYSTPLTWSQMLTVWRKLHVEVDSMGPPDLGNSVAGTIQAPPTFNPTNNHAIIDIANLVPDDWETVDQHKVGRIDITGFGAFTTIATMISTITFDDQVEIINAPANIVNANGAQYRLWDDDAGSVPPFVMIGFDAPPVTLPKIPDSSLMAQVFKDAYIDVPSPDMQYYDTNSPFDRNVDNSETVASGERNRDLSSTAGFWVVHITSAFQGYTAKDGDPDIEEATEGLQYGITGVPTLAWWTRAGSLIYLETIRERARGDSSMMNVLERYTVVHEAGHQFKLEHEDGRWPNEADTDPSGDYIMTDKTNDTGMAPNLSLGAKCLKKVRELQYPPQP